MNLIIKSYYFNNKNSSSLTDLVDEYNTKKDLVNLRDYIRDQSFSIGEESVLGSMVTTLSGLVLTRAAHMKFDALTYIFAGIALSAGVWLIAKGVDYVVAKTRLKKKLENLDMANGIS